jgi:hypothetical protein
MSQGGYTNMTTTQLTSKKPVKKLMIKPTDVFPMQKHHSFTTLQKPEILPLSYYFYTLQQASNKKQYVFHQYTKPVETDYYQYVNKNDELLNINQKHLHKNASNVFYVKKEKFEKKHTCINNMPRHRLCGYLQSGLFRHKCVRIRNDKGLIQNC